MYETNIISLGAGVQSTTLCYMAIDGVLPMPDAVIMADTGAEMDCAWTTVYHILEELSRSVPFILVTAGKIDDDVLSGDRFASPPFFIRNENGESVPGRRQCTREYKISPINKYVRQRYKSATMWIGISMDKQHRAKGQMCGYIMPRYPLLELKMNRADCIAYIEKTGRRVPEKSSCYFCPYHNDRVWLEMKTENPKEFARACDFDDSLRGQSQYEDGKPQFVHRSCKPLREVVFKHEGQAKLDFVCEGGCGL